MQPYPSPFAQLTLGTSAVLPTMCTSASGPPNVDGQCVSGGSTVPPVTCEQHVPRGGTDLRATLPVYVTDGVPYTRGRVAGHDYERLARMYSNTRLNESWASLTSSR